MGDAGGQSQAAELVRSRMESLFQAEDPQEQSDEIDSFIGDLLSTCDEYSYEPVSSTEVITAVSRLKPGKSTGLSGVSGEFFKAIVQHEEGLAALRLHFDLLLRDGVTPKSYQESFVCLVPKPRLVAQARDLRPMNLIEVVYKLLTAVVCNRVTENWVKPRHQLGGMRGCQVLDALFCTARPATSTKSPS